MKKERAKLGKPAKPGKGIIYALLGFASIVIVLGLLHAQTFLNGGQSRPPDSFVQVAAESQGLSQVAPEDLPRGGTYWWVMPNGCAVPTPFLPRDLNGPVYQITDAQFLVDTTGGQVALNSHPFALQRQTTANTVATVIAAHADAVVNLINQIQARDAEQQMRSMAMAMGIPSFGGGFGDGGGGSGSGVLPSGSTFVQDYGTNLWVAQTTVAAGYLTAIATNTEADIKYEILSRTNLLQTDWQSEGFIFGSELTNWTRLSVAQNGRPILFIRLRSWIDSYDIGIPDWWQLKYFDTIGIDPDVSAAGDGYSNLEKFQMGLNPTNYYNTNGVPNFFGCLDASGTNAFLEWSNAPGPVINYVIQRGIQDTNTGNYVYTQIGLVSSNATFFEDVGAITTANAQENIYNLWAVYPGGSYSATNSWTVAWYSYDGSYGPPYGPPMPGNFWANADTAGTNVLLSWTPAAGDVTNYAILRGSYNPTNYFYNYTLITNVNPTTTNLEIFGALTNDSNWTVAYEIEAVYPGGGIATPVSTLPDYVTTFTSVNVGANTNAHVGPGNFYGYTDSTGTNIFLTWSSVAGAVTNYLVYGGVQDSTTGLIIYHRLARLGVTTNSFAVIGAVDGSGNNRYSIYNVVAVYTNGSLSQSAAWNPGNGAPAPGALYAWLDSTGTNVQLAWRAASGAVTEYLVERSDDYGNYPYQIGQVASSTTSLTDTNAVNTGSFDPNVTVYQVQAKYANGGLSPAVTAMVSNTPAGPTSLTATVDNTGTNVTLAWTQALGNVSSYTIQRGLFNQNTGNYSYTTIATVSTGTTTLNVIGAITSPNNFWDVYTIQANYPNSSVSAPSRAQLSPASAPLPPTANLNISAQLVRNESGQWQLMFSGIPTNVQTVRLNWCFYDYFYNTGPQNGNINQDLSSFTYCQPINIPVASLTNGVYLIPDWQLLNYFPNNWYGDVGYVQGMDANGNLGSASLVGYLRYDSPRWVDGRQHLKQNLRFQLQAATVSQPSARLAERAVWFDPWFEDIGIPADTNYVESSIFHWSVMLGAYTTYVKMDDVWPFTANYELHHSLYDPTYTGPADFQWQTNSWGWSYYGDSSSLAFQGSLATVPAPAVLGVNPCWILQFSGLGYTSGTTQVDPVTGLPLPPTWTPPSNLNEVTASADNYYLYLNGGNNLFGLTYQAAVVNTDSFRTLSVGGSVAVSNITCFYSQTAPPNLSLTDYYFAPVNTPGTALPDSSTPNQLFPLPCLTGFANTNQTGVMITSVGTPTTIGGWAKFSIQNGSCSKFAYLGQYYVTNAFIVTNGIVTTNTTGVVSPYGDFFPTAPGVVAMVTMPDIDNAYVQGTGIVRVVSLNVDANHDGTMDFTYQGSDFVSASKPFRFWVNDNTDEGDYTGTGIPGQGNQGDGLTELLTASTSTYFGSQPSYGWEIHGRRDLVDFFPVCLNIGSVFQSNALSAGISATDTNYQFVLSQADNVLRFAYTSLTPTNYMYFLQDITVSSNLAYASLITISNTGVVLPQAFLSSIATSNQNIILVEAAAPTTQPLVLTIYHGTNQIAQTSLYLSISGVEQMFRHKNLLMNISPKMPDRLTDASVPNEPDTINKNFVFLHGYNVLPDEARGVAADMFKRLYWSGSHAKFWAVTWEGADTKGTFPFYNKLTPNYHTNVYNAFLTATNLASFIASLTNSGSVVATAHSLGNMVVLSAISDWNAPISQYFMLDAAVPIEAIDSSSSNTNMILSTWQSYSNRLFAANWYQLFSTNDARSTLFWNNRLGNLGNVDVYNFYSSGEEVLRLTTDDPPSSTIGILAKQVINRASLFGLWPDVPFGTYTWYWQEKGKGTCDEDGLIGSSHGGWRFSDYYYGVPVVSANSTAYTPNSMLPQHPFFDFSRAALVGPPHPDLALTNTVTGSAYAAANRNRILSDAIPAMSLVVGANPVPSFDSTHNLNMNTPLFQNSWSQGRSNGEQNKWHHSDFVQMAYTFTYKLFNQFVTTGNLK